MSGSDRPTVGGAPTTASARRPMPLGMRLVDRLLRSTAVSRATPEEIERTSGATAPEPLATVLLGRRVPGVTMEDLDAEGVPVRVYRPGSGSGDLPLVLYFHGGGFVHGDLRGGDWLCSTIARHVPAVVVSVAYRLAPKHPFPAAVEDCVAATRWAAAEAARLGADGTRIGVVGDSAGGNLAAVVALDAREHGPRILHQALVYPVTGAYDSVSRREGGTAPVLTTADIARYEELYGAPRDDWRNAPLAASSFEGLPPALLLVAGHDPLRDDGLRYAEALEAAGVDVDVREFPAMPHGFVSFPHLARDARAAVARVVSAQRRALGSTVRQPVPDA